MGSNPNDRSRVTRKQIALVNLAAKELGFVDDGLLSVLFHIGGGAMKASELDAAGFDAVMAYFTAWGFRSNWTKRTFGDRQGMATPRQVDLIRDLWREWSGADDEPALNAWLERSYGVSALRFTTSAVASKAIAGLKAMKRRKPLAG